MTINTEKTQEHEREVAGTMPMIIAKKASPPWVTFLMIGICVAIFIGFLVVDDSDSWETHARFGHLPEGAIWDGAYWALITSAFVHVAIWHLGFNMYWLWVLGRRLELEIGSLCYFAFVLPAAFVGSSFQLAASDNTGIGASGIVYAIFGFMWLTRQRYHRFQEVLDAHTIQIFVGWLFGGIVVTWMQIGNIGNAAHISGLLFGAIVAGTFVLSYKRGLFRAALAILLVLSFVPLFFCHWSISWWSHSTYKAHVAGRYDVALAGYSYIIERSPDNAWAYESRSMVNESLGNREQAEADFQRACELDPSIRGGIRE